MPFPCVGRRDRGFPVGARWGISAFAFFHACFLPDLVTQAPDANLLATLCCEMSTRWT